MPGAIRPFPERIAQASTQTICLNKFLPRVQFKFSQAVQQGYRQATCPGYLSVSGRIAYSRSWAICPYPYPVEDFPIILNLTEINHYEVSCLNDPKCLACFVNSLKWVVIISIVNMTSMTSVLANLELKRIINASKRDS